MVSHTTTEFAQAAGISISYASQILSGKRAPSLPLAISIYRTTGRKFGPIAQTTDEDIEVLARLQDEAA